MKLEKDLYVYVWKNAYENNCNSYVIGGALNVLIDPGHAKFVKQLFSQMEEDGLSPEAVDLIVSTHSHPDHLEGLAAFMDKPTKMAMSEDEERYLLGTGRVLFEMMGQSLPRFRVDFYLKEGKLHLGENNVDIIQTPGHSPGSLSMYWPERKALFTGDVVFYGGIGRTDFPEGDSKALMESIERLSQLETEILLPGHGEIVLGRDAVIENFETIRQSFYPTL
jgi:glyoxylase-like metal-dependent hydrolase (beta-lactamase superfamily II)